MSNTDELIRSVLESKKLSGEKVYGDQPLIFTASKMKSYTPPEYTEMRKLALQRKYIFAPAAEIFYIQAKFMENFTDDFEYHGQFLRSFPTYREMSNLQLRGYFSWRTAVRKCKIEKTCISFVYVYLYELLNLIGAADPEDVFFKLKNFAAAYSEYDKRVQGTVSKWLIDFAAYYNLDPRLLKDSEFLKNDGALLRLMNYEENTPAEALGAIENFSSYKIRDAAFYKKFPERTEAAVYNVFGMLLEYYTTFENGNIYEKLFGKKLHEPHFIFDQAVFYEKAPHPDCVYEINGIYRYICRDNKWSIERFYPQKDKAGKVGSILKGIDSALRLKFGFKPQIKSPELSRDTERIIKETVDTAFAEERKAAAPKIEIDVSKLQSIRDTADITRDKLIVDEEEPTEQIIPESEPAKAEATADEPYLKVLKALFCGADPEKTARDSGIMLTVAIDEINERLFDDFGDTVIIFNGDTPEIIEDYKEDLKGMFNI